MPDEITVLVTPPVDGIGIYTRWQGNNLTLTDDSSSVDPTSGRRFTRKWIGTKAQIDAQEATSIAAGWSTSRSVSADQHTLTINTADPQAVGGPAEVPVDNYQLATEYETVPFWSNPRILGLTYKTAQADQIQVISAYRNFCIKRIRDCYFADDYVTDAEETTYRKDVTIAKYITAGQGPTPFDNLHLDSTKAITAFGFGDAHGSDRTVALKAIYHYAASTGNHWEVRRVVLSRRRSVSIRYANRYVVDGVEYVYSTSMLKALFAIPADVGSRLPADPAVVPPNCVWGWRIRRQDSTQVRGTGRVEENVDWLFAAWSTLIYTPVL